MVRPEDFSSERMVNRRRGLAGAGEPPLLVGGVTLLTPATGLFLDHFLIRHLRTDKRYRDYLEFRDEAIKIAAEELVAATDSPVDLFLLTERDEKLLQENFFKLEGIRDKYSVIFDDESKGSGVDNISMQCVMTEDQFNHIERKNDRNVFLSTLHHVRRYFAYRKGLLKLDFIQWNSDPEVLNRIKLSTRWSELDDDELKLGLENHMRLLKKNVSKLDSGSTSSSISKYEKIVNSSLSAELEKHLSFPDQWLMHEFFNRAKVGNFMRECSNQAQKSGIILVEEFLPVRRHAELPAWKDTIQIVPKSSPLMKQIANSFEGCMSYLHGRAARVGPLVFAAVSALTVMMAKEDDGRIWT